MIMMMRLDFSFSLYSLQVQNSTNDQVVLDPIELASTGKYRCEVSAEAPSFQTVSDHGEMTVVGKFHNGDGNGKPSDSIYKIGKLSTADRLGYPRGRRKTFQAASVIDFPGTEI